MMLALQLAGVLMCAASGAAILALASRIASDDADTDRAVTALWRLLAVLPPGRRHERNARRELGMAPRHPEHVTRPPSARDRDLLDALQLSAWPLNEWVDVLLYRGGGA